MLMFYCCMLALMSCRASDPYHNRPLDEAMDWYRLAFSVFMLCSLRSEALVARLNLRWNKQ
jgi:hypothetical protein